MAQDIIPMEPVKAVCPHCNGKVLVNYSIAVYESGDAFQLDGLTIDEPKKARKVSFMVRGKAREGEPKPRAKRVSFISRR